MPRLGYFFATLSQLFIFSLPASLFNMMLGGFSCERGKNSLVFTRGFVGSANALSGCTPGKRRGRLESFQLEVVVPLPKKQNKTKIWKLIPCSCAKREE